MWIRAVNSTLQMIRFQESNQDSVDEKYSLELKDWARWQSFPLNECE